MVEFLKANMIAVTWIACAVLIGFSLGGGNPYSVLSGIEAAAVGGIFSGYLTFYVLNGSTNEPVKDYLIRLIPLLVGGVVLITAWVKGWPVPHPIEVGIQGTTMGMFVAATFARLRRG
jgi:hypothetical protein